MDEDGVSPVVPERNLVLQLGCISHAAAHQACPPRAAPDHGTESRLREQAGGEGRAHSLTQSFLIAVHRHVLHHQAGEEASPVPSFRYPRPTPQPA